ncbi:HlyD family secretion protein [Rhizobium sp. SG570]|uniref:HlyD family secretion protein n=1 Tax=Rhizobium sp. SG570 TaxID=2587113 RepID=UPI0017CD5263|nr:HlyD family secretion protein [Rhizobium sp. SG570]NKJ39428.1 multidrug efflux pump subunit AcrA (membrane-fusion protein) [Rhizobium sp. SG570]
MLETGKTAAIPDANGSKVKAGDVVVELDPTETRAEVDALLASLRSLRAEVIRRTAASAQVAAWQRGGLWTSSWTISTPLAFDKDIPLSIRTREEAQFQSSLEQLASSLANLSSQREQQLAPLIAWSPPGKT